MLQTATLNLSYLIKRRVFTNTLATTRLRTIVILTQPNKGERGVAPHLDI